MYDVVLEYCLVFPRLFVLSDAAIVCSQLSTFATFVHAVSNPRRQYRLLAPQCFPSDVDTRDLDHRGRHSGTCVSRELDPSQLLPISRFGMFMLAQGCEVTSLIYLQCCCPMSLCVGSTVALCMPAAPAGVHGALYSCGDSTLPVSH
jgi:hypothetical protein